MLLVEETGVPRQNHWPTATASHWLTLSHNVLLSTPHLSGIRAHNVSGDRTDCICSCKSNYHMRVPLSTRHFMHVLWAIGVERCLNQYLNYIAAVCFIWQQNSEQLEKITDLRKSLKNFITKNCILKVCLAIDRNQVHIFSSDRQWFHWCKSNYYMLMMDSADNMKKYNTC